jgi:hypothetical protein
VSRLAAGALAAGALAAGALAAGALAGGALGAAGTRASAARAAGRPPCPPPGAHVLARDRLLRVYSTGTGLGAGVVACRLRTGTRMTLLPGPGQRPPGLQRGVGGFELAGGLVGYRETQFGIDSGTTRLLIADVGRRRVLRSIAGGSYVDAGLILSERVDVFVLTAAGAVAWVTTRREHGQLTGVTVSAAPPRGSAAVLDRGTAIDPTSLRLSGATLSWRDGGATRTARMP